MAVLKNSVSEDVVVQALVSHFKRDNCFRIYQEVAFLNRRIDLVLVDRRDGEISAIEAKVSWWNRAIEQARFSLLGVDKAYIALPRRTLKGLVRHREVLSALGIGFLAVTLEPGRCRVEEMLVPQCSRCKSPIRERELRASIHEGIYLKAIK